VTHPVTHIGVTGSRHGTTTDQRAVARNLMRKIARPRALHHGDCVGADEQLCHVARQLGDFILVSHPPIETRLRAYVASDEVRVTNNYHARNRGIVYEVSWMIALPQGFVEELRGGTWNTVRITRAVLKPLVIIFPDGTLEVERLTPALTKLINDAFEGREIA
jgi:hypothetical protein